MKVTDYIINKLNIIGVTDTFGIPGGVILKLISAMHQSDRITPHLNYHEQAAGFAACGYAQASGKLGVAFATRGPGICNMFTCIAEAYQESLPVMFITAHGATKSSAARFESNQEMDISACAAGITKFAVSIDDTDDVRLFEKACRIALSGRKGPVLVDISASLWDKEISEQDNITVTDNTSDCSKTADYIIRKISSAKRPVILIGDGLRYSDRDSILDSLYRIGVPVLSSRGAQDIAAQSSYYFGYIGSHGTRYSNFILSKADLIIAIGNRLSFPVNSESFAPIMKNACIIRADVDYTEFVRKIPNCEDFHAEGAMLLSAMAVLCENRKASDVWLDVCNTLLKELSEYDKPEPVQKLEKLMSSLTEDSVYVADVGNNEFWLSRAYESLRPLGMLLCSKSFGTLGSALGKAIGAYHATGKRIICVSGDQGFQFNLQELQYISQHELPITVTVMNNRCSGMISDHEKKLFGEKLFLVDETNGYLSPEISRIADAYRIAYTSDNACLCSDGPVIYEITYNSNIPLVPNLPKGNPCEDMEPLLDREKYNKLNII